MFDFIAFILMILSTIHLHEGNTWTYASELGHQLRIIEIAGKKEIQGKSFFIIKDSGIKETVILVRKAPGYLEVKELAEADKSGQKFPLIKEDPVPFFFFPDFSFEAKNVRREDVTTPAGSFEGCKVFDLFLRRKAPEATPEFLGTLVYKKGVGLVKMEGPLFGQGTKNMFLTSYHVVQPTVAILDLEEILAPPGSGKMIAETIRSQWIRGGEYRVVERAMIKKVLDELQLSQTGLIDSEKGVKIGKMLGAEKVLMGSVSKVDRAIIVNWRLIEVETGLASGARTVTADTESELLKKISSEQ